MARRPRGSHRGARLPQRASPQLRHCAAYGASLLNCAKRNSAEKRRTPHSVAVEVMRAAGVEPLDGFPGVDVPWRCRCLNALRPGFWMGNLADIRRSEERRVGK